MRIIWLVLAVVISSLTTALVVNIQTGEARVNHCEKVILTGMLKLSKKPVTVETLACKEFGEWHLPFDDD